MATKTQEPVIGDGSLHVGDRVVYPNQGICRITGVETKQIAGQNWEVVTLSREEDGATVMVPKAKVMGIGLRKVADVTAIDRVFDELANPNTDPIWPPNPYSSSPSVAAAPSAMSAATPRVGERRSAGRPSAVEATALRSLWQ